MRNDGFQRESHFRVWRFQTTIRGAGCASCVMVASAGLLARHARAQSQTGARSCGLWACGLGSAPVATRPLLSGSSLTLSVVVVLATPHTPWRSEKCLSAAQARALRFCRCMRLLDCDVPLRTRYTVLFAAMITSLAVTTRRILSQEHSATQAPAPRADQRPVLGSAMPYAAPRWPATCSQNTEIS